MEGKESMSTGVGRCAEGAFWGDGSTQKLTYADICTTMDLLTHQTRNLKHEFYIQIKS